MKTIPQLIGSCSALFGLACAVASHAAPTSLAELPLKASLLAKPNVIFGMDDSGSMDGEILLYNNDGAFWWDYTNASGWGVDSAHPNPSLRTTTSTWFNAQGASSNRWRKFIYLFPVGTGAGNRVWDDNADDHFAVLPTAAFAFTRWSGVFFDTASATYKNAPNTPAQSPVHNSTYYNPLITYAPWAPAQLSTGAVVPQPAVATAAKSHPIYGSTTLDLTSSLPADTSANAVFTALPGMRVPAGAQIRVCDADNANCSAWTNVNAEQAAAAGRVTRVAMSYYPATYWVKEPCTPQNTNAATDSCASAPDGSTLRRYEIKSGKSFPSGRSYQAEMQNFANWFQYHRKRKLMLAGAMGETMESLTGMRLGVIPFNRLSGNVTLYDADAAAAASNRLRVAGIFYENEVGGGTPTRETLKYIGEQFKRTDKDSFNNKYNVIQLACQRNNAFLVTDGFANASSVAMPSWDSGKSASNWGATAPYANTFSGSLADLALRYYTNLPRPLLPATDGLAAGKVEATPTDSNTSLHMNTYGLSIGARGTLFLSETTPPPTSAADWPEPKDNRSPTSVDDLWHATINGRGKMYLASTPDETALRIRAGLDDIISQVGAQGGVAVSSVNLARGDSKVYLGVYNPSGWTGDLTANAIDPNTGAIGAEIWRANTLLMARNWNSRVIFSAVGNTGYDFDAATFPNVNPGGYNTSAVVQYLRGNRTGEGTQFRARLSLIGPVVNAEPVLAREESAIYLASGEGMLHAFDTRTGEEQWAFIPPGSMAAIGGSVERGWAYRTLLDATPTYGKLSTNAKLLVGGLGAAGRSYYALDVSSPLNLSASQAKSQFKWTFPAASDTTNDALMGYTVGKPVLAKVILSGSAVDVVLVTSGYDNAQAVGDGRGRLWVLRATDGAVLKSFRTTVGIVGTESGLAHVAAFKEADGTSRWVYGGDLLGNLWKFDLHSTGTTDINAELMATLKDASGNAQPVTSRPELVYLSGKRVVLVGTGRVLDVSDFGSSNIQSFYAIADGTAPVTARSSLVRMVHNASTDTISSSRTAAFTWTNDKGWYFDLPAGEQVNTDPVVAYGAVSFTSNKNGSNDCSQSSRIYLLDVGTGLRVSNSTFVSDEIAPNAMSSRVTILRTADGRLIGTTQRSDNRIYQKQLPMGVTIAPSKNAWREIRR